MAHTVHEKDKLLARIKRIQGQMGSIRTSIEDEGDCFEILNVVASCRGALNGLMAELIEGHVKGHVLDRGKKPTAEQSQATEQLIGIVKAYLK
jgi:FrmR/RcnR family transcriptional regulator, repressor of frmRAB operon